MSKASAGSGATSMPALPDLTTRVRAAFRRHMRHRHDAHMLSGLDDRMLKDIGLTRADVLSLTHGRSGERD